MVYGDANLPCELGSGSGNDTITASTSGGGIIGTSQVLFLDTWNVKNIHELSAWSYIFLLTSSDTI